VPDDEFPAAGHSSPLTAKFECYGTACANAGSLRLSRDANETPQGVRSMKQNLFISVFFSTICGLIGATAAQSTRNVPAVDPGTSRVVKASSETEAKVVSPEEVAAEYRRLEGVWHPRSATLAGDQFPDEICRGIELSFKDKCFDSFANGEEMSGKIELDMSVEPHGLNLHIDKGTDKGKTLKCIYKIEDGCLHLAYSIAFDNVRPTEFESNQDNKLLLLFCERAGRNAAPSTPSAQGRHLDK
jgi:uncharacterized protein (TIGR03067 family)